MTTKLKGSQIKVEDIVNMSEGTVSDNTWNLDEECQSISTLSVNVGTTIVISGHTDDSILRINHILRIDNTSNSGVTITLSNGVLADTHIDYIRCCNNTITIPAGKSLELSCYITKENIGGTDKYVANVTEYNGLVLY